MISEDRSLCARPGQFSKSHHLCFQGQKHPRELSRCSALRTLVDAENSNQRCSQAVTAEKGMSEYVSLVVDECCIFQRTVYLDIDCHVSAQFRGVDRINLLDFYKSCPLALLGRWQGQ